MTQLRFHLTPSSRSCCYGHTDTYDIKGADELTQRWLSDWDLYCATCKALTLDMDEFAEGAALTSAEGAAGFLTQVPIDIQIVWEDESQ